MSRNSSLHSEDPHLFHRLSPTKIGSELEERRELRVAHTRWRILETDFLRGGFPCIARTSGRLRFIAAGA